MKKPVTKIICAAVAAVVVCGVSAAAGCSPYNAIEPIDYTPSENAAVSNGGFAVEKDGYVYFINGVESNTAENTYGVPVKGAIMRVSSEDLANRNYSSVDMVVPQIAYSGNHDSGIFIYGDYVYYSTPSVSRTADGTVQNTTLDLKSTRLDGTESMKNAYITFPSLNYDYRYVKGADGTVYILYVASESLYGESSSTTNLHSLNTQTGVNTLLAYNIGSYLFDAEDKTNPRVYYTMSNYTTTGESESNYNQLFTVTADATEPKEYDVSSLVWWNGDENRYINCGDFVFDGIGYMRTATPFNFKPDGTARNGSDYTYTLETYRHGTLFYTRHTKFDSSERLFMYSDKSLGVTDPVTGNAGIDEFILLDGSSADGYMYLFDGDNFTGVINNTGSEITVNKFTDGKLSETVDGQNCIRIATGGSMTLLFTDGDYLYYSASDNSNNGYTFFRVNYTGKDYQYKGYPDEDMNYRPVRILDLDAATDWYMPELFGDTILFASETTVMSSYNYIMACNVGDRTNAEIKAMNEKYEGITGTEGIIGDYGDSDKYPEEIYANLANAARYLFYTGDIEYVEQLAAACNAKLSEGDDPVYSDNTIDKLKAFLAPSADNDWADYTDTVKVDGKDVYSNRHDYYYSLLGRMSESDSGNYAADFRTEYLKSWPEEEQLSWWDGLNTVARVFFIIGMCLAGILVIFGIFVAIMLITRKLRANKTPAYTRRRIRVDVTDDKSLNVYGEGEDETATPTGSGEAEEPEAAPDVPEERDGGDEQE